jgi:sugar lactone lactonase YvrE
VILGKPDFGEIVPNEVTGGALFLPAGTIVDRSATPNRIYVYDGGNSRVLGFDHLGTCAGGAKVGQNCTANSDCPGSTCTVVEGRGADLVLGQPSLNSSACNGDGAFQRFPTRAPASATTLCTMQEDQISVAEWIPIGNMFVDGGGNLYVPDSANNRVLRYNSPFTTDRIADDVWGQADFTGNNCNRGASSPDAQSTCFPTGVALDSGGNLWVADFQNNRVLRFPYDSGTRSPSHTADLVMGQPDFVSKGVAGYGLNQMGYPNAVRIDSAGSVYVADSHYAVEDPGRVLIFAPPLSSGMAATGTLPYPFNVPTGLEVDPAGGIWVNDTNNNQLLLFVGGVLQKVLFTDEADSTGQRHAGCVGDRGPFTFPDGIETVDSWNMQLSRGSTGVDGDGNVFASGFNDEVWRFPGPIPTSTPLLAHSADARLFDPYQQWIGNEVGLGGLSSPSGIAVAADQLIVADGGRLLFWNHPPNFTNGQTAAGYVGVTDPRYQPPWLKFGRIREDTSSHLWAIWSDQIRVYSLPLHTGDTPFKSIGATLPVLGGGSLTWDSVSLDIGGIGPVGAGDKVWIADPNNNRVFRIRNALTNPVVDIVLGQTSASGTQCNQGRGETLTAPSQDSLCKPGAVRLDPQGNLYVADDAAEVTGNYRLLEYDAGLFPDSPASALFAIPSSRVFGTGGSFTTRGCQWQEICTTLFEPAFSSNGQMVVGGNAYQSPRFPLIYTNPLVSQHVSSFLNDLYSWPQAATFDSNNNLYVVDGDRFRVLIYLNPLSNPPPASFTLTVTRTGSGSGTVTSTPFGIDCGTACSQTYVNGTTVTLSTQAAPNSTFVAWSGTGCSTGVVTMSAARACTATFAAIVPGELFYTLTPCRVLDTRTPSGPSGGPALVAGAIRTFPVANVCNIPSTARAISANLTVTNVRANGNLQAYAGTDPPPPTNSLSFKAGVTRANNGIIRLGTDGRVAIRCVSTQGTDVILDVTGFFE